MYNNGFLKVSLISPKLEVGNPEFNVREMLAALKDNPSAIAVFPELGITGYTCNDLFFLKTLYDDVDAAVRFFLKHNSFSGIVVCGLPLIVEEMALNAAMVIQQDRILGVVPKSYLPSTREYYEKRWFKSGLDVIEKIKTIHAFDQEIPFGNLIFTAGDIRFGVEVCEDMWATITPGNLMSVNGANIIINISASNETLGKEEIRRNAVAEHSRKNSGIYLYCSAGASESSSDTVFSGHNIVAQNGIILREAEIFSLETNILYADIDIPRIQHERRNNSSFRDSILKYRFVYQNVPVTITETSGFSFTEPLDSLPFVPKTDPKRKFEKIASIQIYGLAKRMRHLEYRKLLIGVSGGLDSALALLVACKAFDTLQLDRKGIIAVTMPALATSERTSNNATKLIDALGVTKKAINLKEHVIDHLNLIGHDGVTEDTTYENAQARARTMALMNLANQVEGIVLGTGDLSEIALGWSTYNGDQMSMYNVNAGLPKTLVRFMIRSFAEHVFSGDVSACLEDIVATPISPELKKDQATESQIGKYEINDFILYRFLACGDIEARIIYLLKSVFGLDEEQATAYTDNFFKRFYSQQYKRQASPDAPKILEVALSSRSDFRMPSDVKR